MPLFPDLAFQGNLKRAMREGPVAAGATIWRHTLVFYDNDGGLVASINGSGRFAGLTYTDADNSGGQKGALRVRYLAFGSVTIPDQFSEFRLLDEGRKLFAQSEDPRDLTVEGAFVPPIGALLEVIDPDLLDRSRRIRIELAGAGFTQWYP